MKKAFLLLITIAILVTQFSTPTQFRWEKQQCILVTAEGDNNTAPMDPQEEPPGESENEDSKEESKDNDSKKLQQHRLFTKLIFITTKKCWNIPDAKQAIKPYVSQIQQPPEATHSA